MDDSIDGPDAGARDFDAHCVAYSPTAFVGARRRSSALGSDGGCYLAVGAIPEIGGISRGNGSPRLSAGFDIVIFYIVDHPGRRRIDDAGGQLLRA